MDSTFNEGKSAVAERFIKTLKNKIFKHMIAISKNFYFHALDDIVNKYNNTIHRTIKMKPTDDVISDLNGEEIAECFYKKELQKTNQEEFRIDKVIKRKGDKLYVK